MLYISLLLLLLLLLSRFSRVWLCATPEMAAYQALLSLGFSRQEHWSGLPFPFPMHESEKWKWSPSLMSNSSRSHGLQPTRLLRCPPSTLLLVTTNLVSFYVNVSVCLFFFSISLTVYLFYNVLVSTVQQSESIESATFIHMCPLFEYPSHLGHHRAMNRVFCAIH